MPRSQHLSHVAMSVPPGTLTDEWRARVLDFYGKLFGWREMDAFRLPDRLTIAVGSSYVNDRERADAPTYSRYEHFGVALTSADELRKIWDDANNSDADDVTLEPLADSGDGFLSFRLHYLLPLTIEAQYFPPSGA